MTDESDERERVTLEVFQGEPLARLAAQRLREEGIPCMVRPLGVGPGGWGMAANLPYAVYVLPANEAQARDLLALPATEDEAKAGRSEPQSRRSSTAAMVVLFVVAAAVLISAVDRLFGALLR